jgi:hypothetical protein
MSSVLLLLWALTGGAIATWVMIRIWLPDPPPDVTRRFIGIFVAGVVAGVVGGGVVHALAAGSNPMPAAGILGAVTTSLIVSGGWALLCGGRGKAVR